MTERDEAYWDEELSIPAAKAYEYDDVPQCKQPVREWDYDENELVMADDEYDEEYF